MARPISTIVLGAGQRGQEVFAQLFAEQPERFRCVAVAEPRESRRQTFMADHSIKPALGFSSWEQCLDDAPDAELVCICLPDELHARAATKALDAGYHLLLEKPMATTLADTVMLVGAAAKSERVVQVAHVPRYTEFFSALKRVVESGELGDLVHLDLNENVVFWHMAHSFVRGNWRKESESCPMILAKSCHDLDIVQWLADSPVQRVQSFGSLRHFTRHNQPQGAPDRCTDGCPVAADCAFDAVARYMDPEVVDWPVSVVTKDTSPEGRRAALETGPYGRCVYACDNDVVDHQVVNMELQSGATATLTMHGHSHLEGRTLRIDGTKASLLGHFSTERQTIDICGHRDPARRRLEFESKEGHGGGDAGLVNALYATLREKTPPDCTAEEAFESHLLAFAAEESRHNRTVVEMKDFKERSL